MLDFLVGNDLLSAIVAFALVLIPAVIIHELGHLFAAKAVGITILEFGIGFPPRLVKLFRWGETEFTLNLLPLGGFVRPLGEDFVKPVADETVQKDREALAERIASENAASRLSPQEQDEVAARGLQKTMSVNEARPLGRIFFMAAGAFANFASAFVLFVIVAMVGVPEIVGGRVNVISVEPNSLLAQAGLQDGDIIEQVNGEPVLSSGEFFDRLDQLPGEEAVVLVRRGELGDPVELNVSIPATLQQAEDRSFIRVMGIVEGAPADNAGIEPGDLIVNFDDTILA
ncbi:MAG: site-2 protease family protein, partial [Burkholderiales bacterium]|nr:site-2 protease family protein [Anaerolineae bacterium]